RFNPLISLAPLTGRCLVASGFHSQRRSVRCDTPPVAVHARAPTSPRARTPARRDRAAPGPDRPHAPAGGPDPAGPDPDGDGARASRGPPAAGGAAMTA